MKKTNSKRTTYGDHIVLKCCSSVDIYRNFKFPEISKSSGGRGGAAAEGAMAAALGEKEWAQESPLSIPPHSFPVRLVQRGARLQGPLSVVGRQPNLRISDGSFSAVSTPIFASKYSFESS